MSVEPGNMYNCDICGKKIFISNRDLTLEGGLRKLGVHKVEISGMPTFNHMCHDCFEDLEYQFRKKKESFNGDVRFINDNENYICPSCGTGFSKGKGEEE